MISTKEFTKDESDFTKLMKRRDDEIDEINKRLWSMEIDGSSMMYQSKIYDIYPYIEKLNIAPVMSDEMILEKNPKFDINGTSIEVKALLTLVMGGIDGCVYEQVANCEYSTHYNEYYFDLKYYSDACCDIRISGLSPDDCQAVKLNCYHSENVVDAVWNELEKVFEFPDFTLKNPLLRPSNGSDFRIYIQYFKKQNADGVICRYNCISFDSVPRRLLYYSSFGVSRVPSKSSWLAIEPKVIDSILIPYDIVRMIEPEIIDLTDDKKDEIVDVIEVWI